MSKIKELRVIEIVAEQEIGRDEHGKNNIDRKDLFLTSINDDTKDFKQIEYQPSNSLDTLSVDNSRFGNPSRNFSQPLFSDEEKFFGSVGRQIFFERYRWLARQRKIMHTSNRVTSAGFVFDNEANTDDLSSSRLFAPHMSTLTSQYSETRSRDRTTADFNSTFFREDIDDEQSMTSEAFETEFEGLSERAAFALPEIPASPRTAFIASCIRDQIAPRASLLVRKKLTSDFKLPHQGVGDKMALLLAQTLRGIPNVEAIDLRDNHLTDASLCAVATAIGSVGRLQELDLSENAVGLSTAKAISAFITSPACRLRRLTLQDAGLDDHMAGLILTATARNVGCTITDLDLSKNRIGDSETLSNILPEIVTGGEALAALIRSNVCPLKRLDVSWNRIRGAGAVDLAKSLASNRSLTYLDLSYNALGHEGGLAIGDSLLENHTIKTLLLANNCIDGTASFTISVGITENLSLRRISLDGNPIGMNGAKALMQVPSVAGNRVKLTLENCNVILKSNDGGDIFDSSEPFGSYDLRLSQPYDRAVAIKLLEIVASHSAYVFRKFEYDPGGERGSGGQQRPATTSGKSQISTGRRGSTSSTADSSNRPRGSKRSKAVPITLAQSISHAKLDFQDDDQRLQVDRLQMVIRATREVSVATVLFDAFDKDVSGDLNKEEIYDMLTFLGFGAGKDKSQIKEIMQGFKSFSSEDGSMQLFEFSAFLKAEKKEFLNRLKDLTEMPVMVIEGTNQRYVPPRSGVLTVELADTYTGQSIQSDVLTSVDQECVVETAGTGPNASKLIMYAIQTSKVRLKEAFLLYGNLRRDGGDPFRILLQLLPRVVNPHDARALVHRVIGDDILQLGILRQLLGASARPILGSPNGFYKLDLSKEMDRICMSRLLEISKGLNHNRCRTSELADGVVGDVSQGGCWSCFRNEMVNGVRFAISQSMFMPMPKAGKLEFDFSGVERPSEVASLQGEHSLRVWSDQECVSFVARVGLVAEEDQQAAADKLEAMRVGGNIAVQGRGFSMFESSHERAEAIRDAEDAFFGNLGLRSLLLSQAAQAEVLTTDLSNLSPELDQGVLFRESSMKSSKPINPNQKARNKSPIKPQKKATLSSVLQSHSQDINRLLKVSHLESGRPLLLNRAASESTMDTLDLSTDSDHASNEREKGRDRNSVAAEPFNGQLKKSVNQDSNGSLPEIRRQALRRRSAEGDHTALQTLFDPSHSASSQKLPRQLSVLPGTHPVHATASEKEDHGRDLVSAHSIESRRQSTESRDTVSLGPDSFAPETDGGQPVPMLRRAKSMVLSSISEAHKDGHAMNVHDVFQRRILGSKQSYNSISLDKYFAALLHSKKATSRAKAHHVVDILVTILSRVWLLCRHVAVILSTFSLGEQPRTSFFGSYKSELVVALFGRIVDLHNFEVVMQELSAQDAACVLCRIGWLNIFNPLKPEGAYSLDLSLWEERQVLKCLIAMKTVEPGLTWMEERFRLEKRLDPVASWILPKQWLLEGGGSGRDRSGLPKKGLVSLIFVGRTHPTSKQNMNAPLRHSLLDLVLIRDSDLIDDYGLGVYPLHNLKAPVKATDLDGLSASLWRNLLVKPLQLSSHAVADATARVSLPAPVLSPVKPTITKKIVKKKTAKKSRS